MKRILPFIRLRILWFILSAVIIIAGIAALILLKGGYNVGIDFKGGLSQQIRIAPLAFTIVNNSGRVIDFAVNADEASYIKAGEKKMVFPIPSGTTIGDLVKSLEGAGDFTVTMAEDAASLSAALIIPARNKLDPEGTNAMKVNRSLPAGTPPSASIEVVRGLLSGLPGGVNIQEVGDSLAQTFLIRTDPSAFTAGAGTDASDAAAAAVITALEKRFGAGSVIEQSRESLGPQMAQSLAVGSVIAIIIALVLMLVYAWIRFRFNYAVAAIIALMHDVATTFAFVGVFGVELNTAVVAAFLTILGYSINDTVVVYDRIRENEKIMKGQNLTSIMEYSISQTLNRTLITSFTVFIAVFPLFLFGTGSVRDFAVCMVFGILTGTYSSICIASPIALMGQKLIDTIQRKREIRRYGQVQTTGLETRADEPPVSGAAAGVSEISGSGAGAEGTVEPSSGALPTGTPPFAAGTGPVTRIQRVLEKKKKRRH